MKPEKIEDLAFDGGELPDGLTISEAMLFLGFRSLYDYARRVQMPPEQGRREKQRLMDSFRVYRFWEGIEEDSIQMWGAIKAAAAAYRRAPSLEKAERILEIIYGTRIPDRLEEVDHELIGGVGE